MEKIDILKTYIGEPIIVSSQEGTLVEAGISFSGMLLGYVQFPGVAVNVPFNANIIKLKKPGVTLPDCPYIGDLVQAEKSNIKV